MQGQAKQTQQCNNTQKVFLALTLKDLHLHETRLCKRIKKISDSFYRIRQTMKEARVYNMCQSEALPYFP